MFGNSISSKLKQFDVYRKLPSDLTEATVSGAMVSIISTLFMVILFISELQGYLAISEISEMYVDVGRGDEKIRVNMDIIFPNFPCDILSVDAQDVMGSHHVNLEGDLKKYRIDKTGNVINEEAGQVTGGHGGHGHEGHGHDGGQVDFDQALKAVQEGQGCQIIGFIKVNKVPGNFHISSHAFGNILGRLFQTANIQTIDLSHKINHISFGDDDDLKNIKKKFSKGVLNPIDGTQKIKPDSLKGVGVMHQYYISVVPTIYEDLGGRKYFVYQFISNSNELQTHHLPAVYFRYDLSPVTVRFAQERESFFHFLVQVCAIIGGVFTVAGIVDSIVHKSVVAILKKAQMGKLS